MSSSIIKVATLACLLGVQSLGAQNLTTGSVRGRVVGGDGSPVASAQVTATNTETGLARSAIATDAGAYVIVLLPPGVYAVRAQRLGFAPVSVSNVRVRLNETTALDFTLQPAAQQLSDVTVTGERELQVDTRQTGVAEYVSEREIQSLPTLGRDFSDFIALSGLVSPQPEVSTGGTVAIGGGRTSGVNVQIDGADANFNFFGESRGGARIPFTFSLESIKEFQVITNGYDVEFGNYSSGVVNVVTKGGTNDFRANAQVFLRSEALTGREFRQTLNIGGRDTLVGGAKPRDFSVQQFAGNISGPIARDRLHYLISYDGQRRTDPFEAATPTGTGIPQNLVDSMATILETVYGQEGARSDFGRFDKTDNVDVFFGRLDWTARERHRASFRANYANYRSENDGLQFGGNRAKSFGSTFRDKNLSLVGELTSILAPSTFNVFRVQYADEKRPRVSNNFLPLINVANVIPSRSLQWGGSGITYRNDLREQKIQLVNTLTHTRGSHTFKLGSNNIFTEVFNQFWLFGAGEYRFENLDSLRLRRPTNYDRRVPESGPTAPETTFDMQEFSFYAQDEWQMTSRLLLTAGLRYDISRFGDDFISVTAIDTLPGIGSFRSGNSPEDDDNISPRLSLAYDILGNGDQVIRGGAGYFFGRVPGVLGSNVGTGSIPYLRVFCTGTNVPPPTYEDWRPSGEDNPTQCVNPTASTLGKEYSFFASDFEYPETLKANLGYEGRVLANTRVGIDLLFGRTTKNFTTIDLALRTAPVTTLVSESGRPVYATAGFNPRNGATVAQRSRFAGIDRIYVFDNQGKAEELGVSLRVDQRLGRALLRGSYTYNRAKDNSSFTCCTSFESLFFRGDPTWGDLNTRGDRDGPNWGNSAYVRPHTIVFSGLVDLPLGFQVSGILRSMSGTFYTPSVFGDLNGDGNTSNDRPFIGALSGPDTLAFENATEQSQYRDVLGANECLREAQARIIERNTCPNPWFTQLDLSVRKSFRFARTRDVEVVADLFNVLNGLDKDWGLFRRVGQTQVLEVVRFDALTQRYVYRVNERFGEKTFIGPSRQFQVQLGAKVGF
jgi:hypothetical protein